MPLLIRIVTGLMVGTGMGYSLFFASSAGELALVGGASVALVFIGLTLAAVWEEPS